MTHLQSFYSKYFVDLVTTITLHHMLSRFLLKIKETVKEDSFWLKTLVIVGKLISSNLLQKKKNNDNKRMERNKRSKNVKE